METTEYTVKELFDLANEDDSWEEDPQMREMLTGALYYIVFAC